MPLVCWCQNIRLRLLCKWLGVGRGQLTTQLQLPQSTTLTKVFKLIFVFMKRKGKGYLSWMAFTPIYLSFSILPGITGLDYAFWQTFWQTFCTYGNTLQPYIHTPYSNRHTQSYPHPQATLKMTQWSFTLKEITSLPTQAWVFNSSPGHKHSE